MPSLSPELPRHPIGVVARRTGLKTDLIRAWERRYGVVEPSRSATGRRLYSDLDIERLALLREAVQAGRGISNAADLDPEQLRALIREDRTISSNLHAPDSSSNAANVILRACLAAIERLDGIELEIQLERAAVELSQFQVIDRVLVPMMHAVGDLWHRGKLRPAHEHLASAASRSFLGGFRHSDRVAEAPRLLVTTPARQHHELGALIVAATAGSEGWRAIYLGPDLPPDDIASAAREQAVRAVALSITFPPDDARLPEDLRRLRRLLDRDVDLIVGGQAARHYAPILAEVRAQLVDGLPEFRQLLAELRAPSAIPAPAGL